MVAFLLVAAVATLTTGALTFREARTGVLKQSQDTVIGQFRDHVNDLAADLTFPPNQVQLGAFAADVASSEPSGNGRVMATYGHLSATSSPKDPFDELRPAMRTAVGSRTATVFQRVTTHGRPALVVGLPVTFGTTQQPTSELSGLALGTQQQGPAHDVPGSVPGCRMPAGCGLDDAVVRRQPFRLLDLHASLN